MSAIPIYYAPDIDPSWAVNPGVCTSMNMFAPLQNGVYGTVGKFSNALGSGNLTGSDAIHAQTFRQVSGSVRFLVFRVQNIDEYDNTGTRTNRGTGYNAATTSWNAVAWGNQIIACNGLDATQSSTGAGFSALAGAPTATRIAANLNFVMLGDVNDGAGFDYDDAVAWCGLQDPSTWTPSLATQAGRIRLLETPGPIRALTAYRDMFLAFKENSMYVGRYSGPFIFEWTLVSSKVGCVGSKAITELDGKLYFCHWSGFYEFDGQQLRNIGAPVFKNWMKENSQVSSIYYDDELGYTVGDYTNQAANFTKLVADDVEGIVWFCTGPINTSTSVTYLRMYGYNVRSGKWARLFFTTNASVSGGSPMLPVMTNYADMQSFSADGDARLWFITQWTTGAATGLVGSMAYPFIGYNSSIAPATFTTGTYYIGQSQKTTRIKPRHMYGSNAPTLGTMTGTVSSWANEDRVNGVKSAVSFVVNSEFGSLDGVCDGPYQKATVTYPIPSSVKILLAGVDIDSVPTGKR